MNPRAWAKIVAITASGQRRFSFALKKILPWQARMAETSPEGRAKVSVKQLAAVRIDDYWRSHPYTEKAARKQDKGCRFYKNRMLTTGMGRTLNHRGPSQKLTNRLEEILSELEIEIFNVTVPFIEVEQEADNDTKLHPPPLQQRPQIQAIAPALI
jgi:hypothetical protein